MDWKEAKRKIEEKEKVRKKRWQMTFNQRYQRKDKHHGSREYWEGVWERIREGFEKKKAEQLDLFQQLE